MPRERPDLVEAEARALAEFSGLRDRGVPQGVRPQVESNFLPERADDPEHAVLSAILDNNIVADFASRGLHGLSLNVMQFFAMAQIAGYALGGCWTHIGCAQSVVAYAFIQRDVDEHYTPVQWIREMTPVIVQTMVLMGMIIYIEGALLS
jgi:hypothetical protein